MSLNVMFTPIPLFLSRYGSVYVEYEIVGPARFEKNVATVISKMFRGDIKLKISNYGLVNVLQVTIKDENGGENCEYKIRFEQFSLYFDLNIRITLLHLISKNDTY